MSTAELSTTLLRQHGIKHMPLVVAELPIDFAVGINFTDDEKMYQANCEIVAMLGTNTVRLPKGYRWNGADIPQLFWTLIGVSPTDRRSIIASGFHDLGCEDDDTPQVMADSNFVTLLRPFRFVQVGNGGHDQRGVGRARATAMYVAVRAYSIFVRPIVRLFGDKPAATGEVTEQAKEQATAERKDEVAT
jgi:hypothetical protein